MSSNSNSERYSRQILFAGIGAEGQQRLSSSRAVIIGCGALGSAQAEALARAGVGTLGIVDRDFIEFSNLQRQTMFTENDAAERLPKAVACANHIEEVNSDIKVEPEIVDANHSNIEALIADADVVLDGTDNFATRYLINDACVKNEVNWIYGAAVGSYGVTMTIRPQQTPCLRCIFPEAPPAASAPTCDTSGVIMPIISVVAAVQVSEALKLLTCDLKSLHNSLMQFDVWRNEWRKIALGSKSADCPTCGLGEYETLNAESREFAAVMCGRHAVQNYPSASASIDLGGFWRQLCPAREGKNNELLLWFLHL